MTADGVSSRLINIPFWQLSVLTQDVSLHNLGISGFSAKTIRLAFFSSSSSCRVSAN